MSWRASLFAKYLAFIVLLVSAGLVASGAINLYFSYQETYAALVNLQREKALTAAVRIEQFLRDIEGQLGWTTFPAVAGGNPLEARRIDFLKLLRQVPAVTEATYIDGTGREQLRISRLEVDSIGSGADLARDPRFVEAKKGRTWFGPVSFRKGTEPYMTIAVPGGRASSGVTAVDVNLKFIWDVISRIRIGQTGYAYVVDDKGQLIAHPDISQVLRKADFSALPQVKAALGDRAVNDWTRVDGATNAESQAVISAYARIESVNWSVFVEEPSSAVLTPLYDAILRTAGLLIAGLALSVAGALFLARRMVEPVRALQAGAERVGAGDLDSCIQVHTGDEIETLADRFNDMAGKLKESYAGLEKKVEARTAELRDALDQQTATADILKVISASPTDVKPVFDAIVSRARELGGADAAGAYRYDQGLIRYVTSVGATGAFVAAMTSRPPWAPTRGTIVGRCILERRPIVIENLRDDPDYDPSQLLPQYMRIFAVPLLRDGEPIGTITVGWEAPGPIPQKVPLLLRTFADQAVIAIENVRLFNEIQDASAQLAAANRHKSDFLANMSHELRTPLNAVIGFSDVMKSGMAGPLTEQQAEFIGDIRDSGAHLLALINDILDLSKIEAGRMELDVSRFDLPLAIDNAMTLVRARADRHGIALATEVDPGIGEYDGDERKFKQILVNLLSNAVKFTPEGGRVTLAAARMNGHYEVSVSDTGIGIAEKDQGVIFEEFRQVGTDYARKAEGTGLGLALTRKLVQLHGGSIRVASEPGHGSTFTFTLPLER